MINKTFAILLLICPFSTVATPISVDFTVGFDIGTVDSISGSIVYDAVNEFSAIDSLISIDLTIGSYEFLLSEVIFADIGNNIIGGSLNGPSGIGGDSNDFWVYWERATHSPFSFLYSLTGDGYNHIYGDFTSLSVSSVNVPEPTSLALLSLGLAGLCFLKEKV